MKVILGLDGLDYSCVTNFNCRNLMQKSCGCTDLSEFSELKTVVLWSSFLAERNIEKEISDQGVLWSFKLSREQTFFSRFDRWEALDVPGFTYEEEAHEEERQRLKDFFDKKGSIEDYDEVVFRNYKRNKDVFLRMLNEERDIQMGYFALADAIGHLSFGVTSKMRLIYQELDDLASSVAKKSKDGLLILSDHGMQSVGRFGDHSYSGFWSFSTAASKDNFTLPQLFKAFADTVK